jgi:hypothetical protein
MAAGEEAAGETGTFYGPLCGYLEAWTWGARLTTSTRRFSGAFKSDRFFRPRLAVADGA